LIVLVPIGIPEASARAGRFRTRNMKEVLLFNSGFRNENRNIVVVPDSFESFLLRASLKAAIVIKGKHSLTRVLNCYSSRAKLITFPKFKSISKCFNNTTITTITTISSRTGVEIIAKLATINEFSIRRGSFPTMSEIVISFYPSSSDVRRGLSSATISAPRKHAVFSNSPTVAPENIILRFGDPAHFAAIFHCLLCLASFNARAGIVAVVCPEAGIGVVSGFGVEGT